MSWKKPVIDVLSIAAFFSRLPFWSVRARIDIHAPAEPLGALAWAFPVAGLLVAIPAAFAVWLLGQLSLQPLVLAGLVVAVQTLSTGALHEDGLADVCDGFGGGSTRDRKLEIMRDSNIGTYGAAGLGLSLLLRAFALAALIAALSPALVASCLLGIAAISRTAMLYQWRTSRPARTDGLARSQSAPTAKSAFIAAALGVLVAIVAFAPSVGIIGTAIAMLISFAVLWGMCRMCERQIGGYTGDTLGAGQQIVEVCLLVSLSSFV